MDMTRTHNPPSALRPVAAAVQVAVALAAVMGLAPALAADNEVLELTQPRSTVEAGAIYVDKDSFKFGEYNGLENKGLHPNLNFDLRGGAAYNNESGSTQRWRVRGTDLGLDVRNLTGEYSEQGLWRARFEYDELRRNYSDSFLTLWNGGGTSTLTLPAAYPTAAARAGSSGLANWNNIQAPNLNATTTGGGPGYVIPALAHPLDIGTTRKRIALGGDLSLSPGWTVSLNARTEKKDGTKVTGVAMGGFKGALMPEPIDSDTTIVEAGARYASKAATLGIGYNTSMYRNHVDAWTIEYPFSTGSGATLNNMSMMNGAPDNQMHQLTFEGSYRFSPTLKLTGAGSYTRMTQNEPFHYQSGTGWNVNGGALSSDSKEVQKNLLLRLTANPIQGVDLNASYKINDRDNRSPVGLYAITQYDGTATPTASTTFRNTPLNRKQQTLTLDGRHSFDRERWVSAGYEHQVTERTADASIDPASHEINNPFASGKAKEDSLRLAYRQGFTETTSGQVSYLHARRRAVDYEEPEVNPPGSSSNVGFFSEVPGFRQFFLNDRNRDKVRGAIDFQMSDAVFLQTSVDWIRDTYPGGEFGLKKTDSTAFNLEGTYSANDRLSFNAFVTLEDMKSHQDQYQIPVARTSAVPTLLAHAADGSCAPYATTAGTLPADYLTDPCRNWSVTQGDRIWTIGFGVKSGGWLGNKLTLTADVNYSSARTNLDFTGGTYYSNGVSANVYIPAQNMPAITSTLTDLKLGLRYAVTRDGAVRVSWLHRKLKSSDPQFDLFGITSVQAYIGSGMTSANYSVNALAVSYVHTFR
jgi:MtrB/PioB family decaheme-associated outer membrane protein